MAAPREIKIDSLTEFAKNIEILLASAQNSHSDASNWYRGHSLSIDHQLKPSLYRHPKLKKFAELYALEAKMMDAFRRQAMLHNFQSSMIEADNAMMQLFYMQHHGVPTRLLDWTTNPFIALYFALANAEKKDNKHTKAAAVWVLDPWRWNSVALDAQTWGDRGPVFSSDSAMKAYLPKAREGSVVFPMYEHPVAIIGTANTPRMLAQRGVFTLFGEAVLPMESVYKSGKFPNDCLVKLEIPAASIGTMLNVLLSIGYTDSVAYPDLQGLAAEIKRLNGFNP